MSAAYLASCRVEACKVRLRPILMTSLATLLDDPYGAGHRGWKRAVAPLARAIIGGWRSLWCDGVSGRRFIYLCMAGKRQEWRRCGREPKFLVPLAAIALTPVCMMAQTPDNRAPAQTQNLCRNKLTSRPAGASGCTTSPPLRSHLCRRACQSPDRARR